MENLLPSRLVLSLLSSGLCPNGLRTHFGPTLGQKPNGLALSLPIPLLLPFCYYTIPKHPEKRTNTTDQQETCNSSPIFSFPEKSEGCRHAPEPSHNPKVAGSNLQLPQCRSQLSFRLGRPRGLGAGSGAMSSSAPRGPMILLSSNPVPLRTSD